MGGLKQNAELVAVSWQEIKKYFTLLTGFTWTVRSWGSYILFKAIVHEQLWLQREACVIGFQSSTSIVHKIDHVRVENEDVKCAFGETFTDRRELLVSRCKASYGPDGVTHWEASKSDGTGGNLSSWTGRYGLIYLVICKSLRWLGTILFTAIGQKKTPPRIQGRRKTWKILWTY